MSTIGLDKGYLQSATDFCNFLDSEIASWGNVYNSIIENFMNTGMELSAIESEHDKNLVLKTLEDAQKGYLQSNELSRCKHCKKIFDEKTPENEAFMCEECKNNV